MKQPPHPPVGMPMEELIEVFATNEKLVAPFVEAVKTAVAEGHKQVFKQLKDKGTGRETRLRQAQHRRKIDALGALADKTARECGELLGLPGPLTADALVAAAKAAPAYREKLRREALLAPAPTEYRTLTEQLARERD